MISFHHLDGLSDISPFSFHDRSGHIDDPVKGLHPVFSEKKADGPTGTYAGAPPISQALFPVHFCNVFHNNGTDGAALDTIFTTHTSDFVFHGLKEGV
jgi:hypothetical protein